MKTKKIKFMSIYILLLSLYSVMFFTGCEENNYSDFVEGYITGSFIADELNNEGEVTGNSTERGFCIMLEGSDDFYNLDFYTFSIPENLFVFPDEILSRFYNGNNCGPAIFPDSLKYAYKIKFKYKNVNERDKIQFITGACSAMDLAFPWENYDEVVVKEITSN